MNIEDLDKKKGENPFNVPEGYFSDFELRLKQRMDNEKLLSKKVVFNRKEFRNILPWAAFFVGFAILIQGVMHFLPGVHSDNLKSTSSIAMNLSSEKTSDDSYALYYVDENDLIDYLADNDDINM